MLSKALHGYSALMSHIAYSVKSYLSKEKWSRHRRYLGYLHETNTIVFTIISTIKQAKFHLPITIITKVELSGYAIYFLADASMRQLKNKQHSHIS